MTAIIIIIIIIISLSVLSCLCQVSCWAPSHATQSTSCSAWVPSLRCPAPPWPTARSAGRACSNTCDRCSSPTPRWRKARIIACLWSRVMARKWKSCYRWNHKVLLGILSCPASGIDWQVRPPSGSERTRSVTGAGFNTSLANLLILRGKDVYSAETGQRNVLMLLLKK